MHNLEDTLSINHNWLNGYNMHWAWALLQQEHTDATAAIEDCRSVPHFRCCVSFNVSTEPSCYVDLCVEISGMKHTFSARTLMESSCWPQRQEAVLRAVKQCCMAKAALQHFKSIMSSVMSRAGELLLAGRGAAVMSLRGWCSAIWRPTAAWTLLSWLTSCMPSCTADSILPGRGCDSAVMHEHS